MDSDEEPPKRNDTEAPIKYPVPSSAMSSRRATPGAEADTASAASKELLIPDVTSAATRPHSQRESGEASDFPSDEERPGNRPVTKLLQFPKDVRMSAAAIPDSQEMIARSSDLAADSQHSGPGSSVSSVTGSTKHPQSQSASGDNAKSSRTSSPATTQLSRNASTLSASKIHPSPKAPAGSIQPPKGAVRTANQSPVPSAVRVESPQRSSTHSPSLQAKGSFRGMKDYRYLSLDSDEDLGRKASFQSASNAAGASPKKSNSILTAVGPIEAAVFRSKEVKPLSAEEHMDQLKSALGLRKVRSTSPSSRTGTPSKRKKSPQLSTSTRFMTPTSSSSAKKRTKSPATGSKTPRSEGSRRTLEKLKRMKEEEERRQHQIDLELEDRIRKSREREQARAQLIKHETSLRRQQQSRDRDGDDDQTMLETSVTKRKKWDASEYSYHQVVVFDQPEKEPKTQSTPSPQRLRAASRSRSPLHATLTKYRESHEFGIDGKDDGSATATGAAATEPELAQELSDADATVASQPNAHRVRRVESERPFVGFSPGDRAVICELVPRSPDAFDVPPAVSERLQLAALKQEAKRRTLRQKLMHGDVKQDHLYAGAQETLMKEFREQRLRLEHHEGHRIANLSSRRDSPSPAPAPPSPLPQYSSPFAGTTPTQPTSRASYGYHTPPPAAAAAGRSSSTFSSLVGTSGTRRTVGGIPESKVSHALAADMSEVFGASPQAAERFVKRGPLETPMSLVV